MASKKQCVKQVRVPGGWGRKPCELPATTERAGQWYCTIHDPERLAQRRAAQAAKQDAEQKTQSLVEAAAKARCAVLGGRPDFDSRSFRYTGGVSLTGAEADALLARLGHPLAPDHLKWE